MNGPGQQCLHLLPHPAELSITPNPHCVYDLLWVKINTSLEKYGIYPFIHPLSHSQTGIEYLL